jgi:hypothetical protein
MCSVVASKRRLATAAAASSGEPFPEQLEALKHGVSRTALM